MARDLGGVAVHHLLRDGADAGALFVGRAAARRVELLGRLQQSPNSDPRQVLLCSLPHFAFLLTLRPPVAAARVWPAMATTMRVMMERIVLAEEEYKRVTDTWLAEKYSCMV